ncbi:hypothetical protein SLA2020_110270 [Shorea laevis]
MDRTFLEITSMGCLLSPSAMMGSRWDTQLTHASLTRCPVWSSTIHRGLVIGGKTEAIDWYGMAGEEDEEDEEEEEEKAEENAKRSGRDEPPHVGSWVFFLDF